jgi:hypothetical protein
MEAYRQTDLAAGTNPEDTIPTWQDVRFETTPPGSSTRLASERPTLPPAAPDGDVMVSHIHLGPSVDEVLYRLSLGDLSGAALANEELEPYVPSRCMAAVVIAAMELTYLEEFVLASIDGQSTWGEILDGSPFNPRDTLKALCELVDKGALALGR